MRPHANRSERNGHGSVRLKDHICSFAYLLLDAASQVPRQRGRRIVVVVMDSIRRSNTDAVISHSAGQPIRLLVQLVRPLVRQVGIAEERMIIIYIQTHIHKVAQLGAGIRFCYKFFTF